MIALLRVLGRAPRPQPTVTWLTPAKYLATREAGRNCVRIEQPEG
ncbi:hypothetical protein [Sphingosinicella sp. BN140058]|nr:hypothetical protein [Sphingosinicella sp. BN140058]